MSNIVKLVDSAFKDGVQALRTPFDVYKLDCKNVIKNSDAFKLQNALLKMPFTKMSCDFYSFCQSPDFFKINKSLKPTEVQQFLKVLKVIKQKISSHLGKQLNNVISVSCSKYDHGDYLLCHDDCVNDRSVAFIYYLNYEWLDAWGGTLDIYSVDKHNNANEIVKSISPEFNTMVFFPVGVKSYHQVAENISKFPRISINGWFHCDDLNWSVHNQLVEFSDPIYLPITINDSPITVLKKSISSIFNDAVYRETIKKTYLKNGEYIMCDSFFKPEVIERLSNEIYSSDLRWKVKSPINRMLYKYIDFDDLPPKFLFLVNVLKTEFMHKFIKDCTGHDVLGVTIEVQRWHGGHYMVSGCNNGLSSQNTINFYLFFSKCNGEMTGDANDYLPYVFKEKYRIEPKFACKPVDNSFFMVHKDLNLDSYVKYCKKVDGHAWTVIVASYHIHRESFVSLIRLKV